MSMFQYLETPLDLPRWTSYVRIAQAILAFLVLILTAYSTSVFSPSTAGFGLSWWTTLITYVFLVLNQWRDRIFPTHWRHITLILFIFEIKLVFWWLVSFAVLAADASILSGAGAFSYTTGTAVCDTDYDGGCDGYTVYGNTQYYGGHVSAASGTLKGAAAMGAFEFCFFVASLVAVGVAVHHRRINAPKSSEMKQTASTSYEPVSTA